MKFPKKVKELVDQIGTDINNINEYDISYLKNIFYFNDLIESKIAPIKLRNSFLNKENILALGGNISIDVDIFFLKLFKEGMVDITLYQLEYNLDTKEGKEFYKFLTKYTINNSYSHGGQVIFSDKGNTIIELDKIINEDYQTFIDYIFLNMLPGNMVIDKYNYDYVISDRLTMDVIIKDGNKFLKGYCKILSYNNNKKEIIDKLVIDFNNNISAGFDKNHTLKYDTDFFINNTGIYSALLHLESTGKISNVDFNYYNEENNKGIIFIEYIAHVDILYDIFFDDFNLFSINNNYKYNIEYTKQGLDLFKGNKKASFKNNSFPFRIVEMFFKNYKKGKIITLQRIYKSIYLEDFERTGNEDRVDKISKAIGSINRATKEMNNGKQLLSFAGESLKEL